MTKSALFVCLGNICRSPIAEAVFAQALQERGVRDQWRVDSAALGDWHVGRAPDRRAQATMKKHNVPMNCKARVVRTSDFREFDYVFGMDESNISELKDLAPSNSTAQIELLGKYDPEGALIIRDPYYDDGDQGFETCYQQCLRCCGAFLDSINVK
ncbi:low molecular weight phosphotyrosine protein phosphatase-like [Amphibalanus amphitrite]|uniref:low molecular weight phosphotyrosine protein phosphatase-like n=1 Tax=Amphibalanus amphitrite TaxID=1232801 RepID=UPI001C91931E|nr:low molecular weight phosphotyrosine protein phosphatase-like [Amphibalanus amphitrite]